MKFFVKTRLSENISVTPEGFLLCRNVPLTHTGSLRYMKGEHPFDVDGEVVMKRDPAELFSPATMASFEGKDLTIQHPEDFVDPDNYQELTNGVLFNIRKSSEKMEVEGESVEVLLGDILVKAKEAITQVNDGVREVSLGYDAFWELINDSEGRHTKIIGNHIALVSSGRAGIECRINDHKKENEVMGKELADKFKKLFGKTVDEAVKEKEDKEAKDAEEAKKAEEEKAAKDAEEAEKKKKEEESKDEGDVESRLSKLEGMLSKILEKLGASEESKDEEDEVIVEDEESEDEESEDEEGCDEGMEEESEDEESEEEQKKTKAGDTLSRAEILAPGIKKTKTIVTDSLKAAYKTADGKKVIDSLTGGKNPSTLSKEASKTVFVAASEMMKAKRTKDFAAQRVTTIDSFPELKREGSKSAADINKMNADFYGKK